MQAQVTTYAIVGESKLTKCCQIYSESPSKDKDKKRRRSGKIGKVRDPGKNRTGSYTAKIQNYSPIIQTNMDYRLISNFIFLFVTFSYSYYYFLKTYLRKFNYFH